MSHGGPASTLGLCPVCDQDLDREWLLERYARENSERLLAGCPRCQEVVQPVRQTDDRTD